MHKGRAYPLDPRLRVYCGSVPYPLWFPRDGYSGSVSTYRSPDWSANVTFTGPWTLFNYTQGDSLVRFRCEDVVRDGINCSCEYWFELTSLGTQLTGTLDVLVAGTVQTRTPSGLFPVPVPTPRQYFDTFVFTSPANPRHLQRASASLNSIGY